MIDWAVSLDESRALETVFLADIFRYREIQATLDALARLELQLRPLPLVDKLFYRLLQVLEHTDVGALNLTMVDVNFNLQLLSVDLRNCKHKQVYQYRLNDSHFLICSEPRADGYGLTPAWCYR